VHRVHGREHRAQAVEPADQRVVQEQLADWRRVGDAGRLDQHAAEGRDLAAARAPEQRAQGRLQVAAERATHAARRQQRRLAFDPLEQEVVEPDLAQLVHDHRAVAHPRLAQQVAQDGGLAAAEEAGDHRHRQALGGAVPLEQAHLPPWTLAGGSMPAAPARVTGAMPCPGRGLTASGGCRNMPAGHLRGTKREATA
jgi:hypothetical protein